MGRWQGVGAPPLAAGVQLGQGPAPRLPGGMRAVRSLSNTGVAEILRICILFVRKRAPQRVGSDSPPGADAIAKRRFPVERRTREHLQCAGAGVGSRVE
jgi:hypothetical protein